MNFEQKKNPKNPQKLISITNSDFLIFFPTWSHLFYIIYDPLYFILSFSLLFSFCLYFSLFFPLSPKKIFPLNFCYPIFLPDFVHIYFFAYCWKPSNKKLYYLTMFLKNVAKVFAKRSKTADRLKCVKCRQNKTLKCCNHLYPERWHFSWPQF